MKIESIMFAVTQVVCHGFSCYNFCKSEGGQGGFVEGTSPFCGGEAQDCMMKQSESNELCGNIGGSVDFKLVKVSGNTGVCKSTTSNYQIDIKTTPTIQRKDFEDGGATCTTGTKICCCYGKSTPPTPPTPPPPKVFDGAGVYTIQQGDTKRYLDAFDKPDVKPTGDNDPGNYGVVTRENQHNPSQNWILTHAHGNAYLLQQQESLRYLDAYENDGEHDFRVVTRPAQHDSSQIWIFTKQGENKFQLQQESSMRYLDAYANPGPRWASVTRPAQGNPSQIWIFTKVSSEEVALDRMYVNKTTDLDEQFVDEASKTAADDDAETAPAYAKKAEASKAAADAAAAKAPPVTTKDDIKTDSATMLTASMVAPNMLMLPAAIVGGAIGGGIVMLLKKATRHSGSVPLLTA